MAELAARKSQEDRDSSQQMLENAQSGTPQNGDRRVTADSFRQLLSRLKKPADAAAPEAKPPVPQTPAASTSSVEVVEPPRPAPAAQSLEMPAPPPAAPAERQAHIDSVELQKRERARAEVHAASQEIIARLRKAAAASQHVVAEAQSPQPAPAPQDEVVAEIAQPVAPQIVESEILPEPQAVAEQQEQPEASAPSLAEQITQLRYVEPEAQPTAAQVEEQELSFAASAPVETAETTPPEPAQAPAETPPVSIETLPVAEATPVVAEEEQHRRRRHPFFPDVFVDDEGNVEAPAETVSPVDAVTTEPAPVAQAEPAYTEQPVPEQAYAEPPVLEQAYAEPPVLEQAAEPVAETAYAEPEPVVAPAAAQVETVVAEAAIVEVVDAVELPTQAEPELVAEAPAQPVVAEAPAQPVIAEAQAQAEPELVAEAPAQPAVAEVAVEAEAEAEGEAGHRDDLIEDEADAVKHLHGVEVKGIGDIARAVFSSPTPAERAAFIAEITALQPPASPEAPPKEILAAAVETLGVQPTMRKILPQDDPFAKISPDVSSYVNNEEPDEDSGELARSLLDMMLSGPKAGLPQERALAADALLKLIPKVPTKALVTISERVSLMEQPPHLLIARLINDPRIEISGPLLEQCNHISDQVLGKVIAGGLVSLQRLIARRRHLSSAMTDMLIEFDDASVLLTLVRNSGATFSDPAFNKLVDHASRHEAILAPLSTRGDLPAHVAFELFWLVPAQLRRYLLSRFLTDSETLTKILKITKVMQNGATEGETSDFANKADVDQFMQALVNGQREEAESKLAAIAGITPACATRIVGDRQGEPLAIIFKAVGLNRAQFEDCMTRLQSAEIGIVDENRQILELLSIFNSMSFNKARILLTYWDWAVQKHGPYASAG